MCCITSTYDSPISRSIVGVLLLLGGMGLLYLPFFFLFCHVVYMAQKNAYV